MTSVQLEKSNARPIEQLKYASYIGSLMYVMHCRFIVCKLSKFTTNPSVVHWRQLKGYWKIKIVLYRVSVALEDHSDASWITDGNISTTS